MISNLILALFLVGITLGGILNLERSMGMAESFFRICLKLARRSRLLTEYLLKAYLHYRKIVSQANFNL